MEETPAKSFPAFNQESWLIDRQAGMTQDQMSVKYGKNRGLIGYYASKFQKKLRASALGLPSKRLKGIDANDFEPDGTPKPRQGTALDRARLLLDNSVEAAAQLYANAIAGGEVDSQSRAAAEKILKKNGLLDQDESGLESVYETMRDSELVARLVELGKEAVGFAPTGAGPQGSGSAGS